MATKHDNKTLEQRFNEKWMPVTESGCWLWTATCDTRGYGSLYVDPDVKMRGAHKVSYELFNGPVGDEHVCHKCDTPLCVNPSHLFLGSARVNMVDMVKKKRAVIPTQRLTKEMVEEAMELRRAGMMVKDIAEIFGIDRGHASRVTRGFRTYYNEEK